jgi:hypothetical protein
VLQLEQLEQNGLLVKDRALEEELRERLVFHQQLAAVALDNDFLVHLPDLREEREGVEVGAVGEDAVGLGPLCGCTLGWLVVSGWVFVLRTLIQVLFDPVGTVPFLVVFCRAGRSWVHDCSAPLTHCRSAARIRLLRCPSCVSGFGTADALVHSLYWYHWQQAHF